MGQAAWRRRLPAAQRGAPGWMAGRGQEEGQPQSLGLSWKRQDGLCCVSFRESFLGEGWWPLCVGWRGLVVAGRRGRWWWWGGQTDAAPLGTGLPH